MLSTHIMQEVEAICDRIIILNKGEIVANDSAKSIISKNPQKIKIQTVIAEFNIELDEEVLKGISGVTKVAHLKENQWLLESDNLDDLRPKVFDFAVKKNIQVLSMQKQEKNLEDIFRELTK